MPQRYEIAFPKVLFGAKLAFPKVVLVMLQHRGRIHSNIGIRNRRAEGAGLTHLSGTEAIQLIMKSGELSTPTGVPAF